MRTTIRISDGTMAFATESGDGAGAVRYERYSMNLGMSSAANLRQAFGEHTLLSDRGDEVLVSVGGPVMLVPQEEYDETQVEQHFRHAMTGTDRQTILTDPVGALGVVAVFGVDRDLCTVVSDNFQSVRFTPLMHVVWENFLRRSFMGNRRKLFAYLHEHTMEVVSFRQNNVRFSNSFSVRHAADAAFFLLSVWQQLPMDAEGDELYVVGTVEMMIELTAELRRFVAHVSDITPASRIGRVPVGMPFDMQLLYSSRK